MWPLSCIAALGLVGVPGAVWSCRGNRTKLPSHSEVVWPVCTERRSPPAHSAPVESTRVAQTPAPAADRIIGLNSATYRPSLVQAPTQLILSACVQPVM